MMRMAMRGALLLVGVGLVACASTDGLFGGPPAAGGSGGDGGDGGAGLTGVVTEANRADVLLVIDNSRNMGDKHAVLAEAVPRLVPALAPIDDIHIGVITSSLGGRGADTCATENDHGHLVERDGSGGTVASYQSLGFLAWDPQAVLSPPGESDLTALTVSIASLVEGTGQLGCGFEATMESWYRFLIDPDPYEQVVVENSKATLVGTDGALLKQRRDFLRPDSLLLIIQLSDENDCSVRDGGQFFFAMQALDGNGGLYHLPKPRAACAIDPDDPCCRSCGQPAADGCDESMDDCGASLSDLDDDINLRCFDQKRRFGIDFLQPLDRYVTALTSTQVQDRDGNIVRNPLFTDLDPSDGVDEVRDPSLVVLAAIVGVPWQDIARIDAAGNPDLTVGIQSASQMTANKTWDLLLGDSAKPPLDPLMIESVKPRSGVQPVTGQAVAPPGAAYDGNSINGHEYDIPDKDDLQYACVFELPTARDCSMVSTPGCECFDPGNKPLCQDPVNDGYGSTQYRAKAYPGVRYLRAAQTLGAQAVVGSICPAQLDSPTDADYGFTAAMTAVVAATDGKRR